MEVVYEYCCGLDIHKKTVVACVVVPGPGKQAHKEIRTFNTMTADLLELVGGQVDFGPLRALAHAAACPARRLSRFAAEYKRR